MELPHGTESIPSEELALFVSRTAAHFGLVSFDADGRLPHRPFVHEPTVAT